MGRRRYCSAPKLWTDWGEIEDSGVSASEFIPRTVTEYDEGPVFSGILDKDGNHIMRWDDREPIGFVIFEEDEE